MSLNDQQKNEDKLRSDFIKNYQTKMTQVLLESMTQLDGIKNVDKGKFLDEMGMMQMYTIARIFAIIVSNNGTPNYALVAGQIKAFTEKLVAMKAAEADEKPTTKRIIN